MCSTVIRFRLLTAVSAAVWLVCAAALKPVPAVAAESSGGATFTIGNTTPTYGSLTLGVSPVTGRPLRPPAAPPPR